VSLLAIVFAAGGILGGVIGGGMLLWAGNNGSIAMGRTPTATQLPRCLRRPRPNTPPQPHPSTGQALSPSDVIESVLPSVVTVINQQVPNFNAQIDEGRVVGSGVIVDSRGYIATNNHVVDNPGELKVLLADGRETSGGIGGGKSG
jgi:S1-C subfamily serine protease